MTNIWDRAQQLKGQTVYTISRNKPFDIVDVPLQYNNTTLARARSRPLNPPPKTRKAPNEGSKSAILLDINVERRHLMFSALECPPAPHL